VDSLLYTLRTLTSLALDAIFPPRDGEKLIRAIQEKDVLSLYAPQVIHGTTSLTRFRTGDMRTLVHEAKFRANTRAQQLLAALLTFHLNKWLGSEGLNNENSIIVPIPLSSSRMKERGFNQCEVIVRLALPSHFQITLNTAILKRVRDTEHQTTLTRAKRKSNVAGAFAVPLTQLPIDPSRTYILFDDVLTTGATLEAVVLTLRAAGATKILPLTLAN
jgi:ComF family protein